MQNRKAYIFFCYANLFIFYIATLIFLDYDKIYYNHPEYLNKTAKDIYLPAGLRFIHTHPHVYNYEDKTKICFKINMKSQLFLISVALKVLENHYDFINECCFDRNTKFHLYLALKYFFISLLEGTRFDYVEIEQGLLVHYNIPPDKRKDEVYLRKKFYAIFEREYYLAQRQSDEMFVLKLIKLVFFNVKDPSYKRTTRLKITFIKKRDSTEYPDDTIFFYEPEPIARITIEY